MLAIRQLICLKSLTKFIIPNSIPFHRQLIFKIYCIPSVIKPEGIKSIWLASQIKGKREKTGIVTKQL